MEFLEALAAVGIEYRLHSSKDDELLLCCPFCIEEGTSQDTRFRLGVNIVNGKMMCFNCGKRSSDPEYTWRELARALETGTLEAASRLVKKSIQKSIELPPDFTPITLKTTDHWNGVALRYLHARNISSRQIKEKNIGYSTVGEFRYRIIVPVYYHGKLEALVARAFVVGLIPKYKNSVGQKVLYNIPDKSKKMIVISEGAFDALAIEKTVSRSMDSGAALGHSLTDKQMEQLEPYELTILWPDPDILYKADVLKGWGRMAQQLQDAKKQVQMVLPKAGVEEYDPSELWPDEIKQKLNGRVDFSSDLLYRMKAVLAFQED